MTKVMFVVGFRLVPVVFTLAIWSMTVSFFVFDAHAIMPTTKGLALSPIRTEIDVAPGTAVKRSLQLSNYSDKPISVNLDAEEFNVTDQQYDYAFSAGTNIAKWVMYTKNTIDLAPGRSESVPYTINVPMNAEPGGHYISLFAASNTQDDPGKIQTRQRVVSLVYLTVKGNVTRIGSLKSLHSPFVFDGYEKWRMVLANDGTTHYRSRYDVRVFNIFDGRQVVAVSGNTLVLPRTKRDIVAQMPIPKHVGLYRVSYTVGLGDTPAAKREYLLIFLPKQMYGSLISLTVIIGAGLSYVVWNHVRRKKSQS